jgi:hypothetical protein
VPAATTTTVNGPADAAPAETPSAPPPSRPAAAAETAAAQPVAKPAVLTLGLAALSAREDHTMVTLDVVRTGDTSQAASVSWSSSSQTASDRDDYVAAGRRTLQFAPGQTTQHILIPLVNDALPEDAKTFTVSLTQPRGARLGSQRTTRVTLYDDD